MKVIFLLVLFLDYKVVRLSKNVIVLSLSDEEAFDRGAFDLGGLLTAYGISSGGVWPWWPKTGGFWPGGDWPFTVRSTATDDGRALPVVGADQGLGDGVRRRGGLLPGQQCHRVRRQRGERAPLHPPARTDHAAQRARHQEPLRDPLRARVDRHVDAGWLSAVIAVVKVRGLWGSAHLLRFEPPCNSMSPLIESIKCYFMPK